MVQARRDGSSVPSLCLVVRILGGCLGQKSPHTLRWCWDKILDDTQLIVNLVLLHNTPDQSSDQKGFVNCMGSGEGKGGRPKKEMKGEMQGSRCHSHCRTPQPSLRNHSLHQHTPTETSLYGPTKDNLLWCNRPFLPEQPAECCQRVQQKLVPQEPKKTVPFFSCTTQQGGPGHQQCSRPGNLQHLAVELTAHCSRLSKSPGSRLLLPTTSGLQSPETFPALPFPSPFPTYLCCLHVRAAD